jgi:hypothetical protein
MAKALQNGTGGLGSRYGQKKQGREVAVGQPRQAEAVIK